jgi:hypothetical protein
MHQSVELDRNQNWYSFMNEYLKKTLTGQRGSAIVEGMRAGCKVCMLIPVYDESLDILLTPLLSLAKQVAAEKNEFEVVMIINNSKSEAIKKTKAFLKNQRALQVIKLIRGRIKKIAFPLSKNQQKHIQEIRESGLVVHAIDKSSLENADEYNNVGVAKNRAGAEICQRFLSVPAAENGIIALTDCDCWFSENYIAYIIETYKEFKLNGLSGGILTEPDPKLANGGMVLQCLRIQRGQSAIRAKIPPASRMFLQRKHDIKKPLLCDSQNITVTVKSWLAVGGSPKFASWENKYFMEKVMALPGEVGRNTGYTVYTLVRASKRAGLSSFGRRVYYIEQAIKNYKSGRSGKTLIHNENKSVEFFNDFFWGCAQSDFSGSRVLELMRQCEFLPNDISIEQANKIINEYRRELCLPVSEQRFDVFEKLVLKYLYPYFPIIDVTDKLISL